MAQYPNEKDPHSNWVYPGRQGAYPPPQHPPNPYASRDGAPSSASGQSSSYAPPSQSQYHAPPPQEHDTSQGPPPDYGYVQSHPAGYNSKDETVLSPPPGYHDPPVPDGGPSSSSGQDGERGGIMMSIASFFGNKGPPPMWQRQAPPQLPYNAEFPPMCLISNGKDLSKGFPELPPPCQLNPHPFVTHDVAEEDWKRFLTDVKKAGSLSPAQRIKSNVIPAVTGMSFVTGFIATFAIEKRMKAKNRGAAGDLVDHWNHYFFGPRRMEVVLCQGSERLSGRLGAAPVGDPQQERMARRLRQRGDDSDSDSDCDSSEDEHDHRHGQGQNRGHGHGSDKQARRAGRRERREGRRQRRTERRARKARGEDQQPYQLFLTGI